MRSSTTVMFRALVMLACLVAIPLAAVVGKSLPEMVRGLLDGRWPGRSASAFESLDEAGFQPAAPADSPAAAAPGQIRSDWQQSPLKFPTSWPSGVNRPSDSAVVAAGHQAPVGPAGASAIPVWPAGAASPSGPGSSPAEIPRPLPAHPGPSAIGPHRPQTSVPVPYGSAQPVADARSTTQQFTHIQDRLRRLGATYSLLESWGTREQLFRFYCRVAVGGNPNYTHYFEATDSDPLTAMARVLRQVEAWRSTRKTEG